MNKKDFVIGMLATLLLSTLALGAIPGDIGQREFQKFGDCAGVPCPIVQVFGGLPSGSPVTYTTTETSTPVECTTTSGTLLAARDKRVEYTWQNQSTGQVRVCRGTNPCTLNTGLMANQFMGISDSNHKGILTCITSVGTALVYVTEVFTN